MAWITDYDNAKVINTDCISSLTLEPCGTDKNKIAIFYHLGPNDPGHKLVGINFPKNFVKDYQEYAADFVLEQILKKIGKVSDKEHIGIPDLQKEADMSVLAVHVGFKIPPFKGWAEKNLVDKEKKNPKKVTANHETSSISAKN